MAGKFYVVWVGRETGVFTNWSDAKKQVDRFPQAKYKSFPTRKEAETAYSSGRERKSSVKYSQSRPTSRAKKQLEVGAATPSKQNADVTIYCDGGCDPNPGQAGSGLAVYHEGRLSELWYGLYNPQGTNNTAELNALHQSLLIAKEAIAQGQSVQIFCDSQYAINCITVWAFSWEKKGWKRKTAGDIKNLELIQEAHALYRDIKSAVLVSHVKAHIGIEGNELADRMSIFGIDRKALSFCRYTEPLDVQKILRLRAG